MALGDSGGDGATPFEIDFARQLLHGPAKLDPEAYAQALSRLVSQFDALVTRLATQDSQHAELQTALKIARSNLVLAEANAEALEEALRRRGGSASTPVGPALVGSTTPEMSQGGWEQGSSTTSSPTFGGSATTAVTGADKLAFWKRKKSNGASALVPPQPNGRGRSPSPGIERSPVLDSPVLPESPATPQPDVHVEQLFNRLANAQSLLEQERRTTRRQNEAIAALKTSFTTLETDHSTLRSAHETLQNEHSALHKELETLSQALFEEANRMVAAEREDKAKLEDEVAELRGQLDEMRLVAEQQLEDQLGLMVAPTTADSITTDESTAVSDVALTPDRPATLPATLTPDADLTRSQQRFRERVLSEPRVEILPPRKQSLSAISVGSGSQPGSRDVSPRPSPRVPSLSTMPPLPASPGLLQQSASLRKTIPAAVRAASPPLYHPADGLASIDAVLERAGSIERSVDKLPDSPSPKGLALRSVPPRGASREPSREPSPNASPMIEGVDSFPAQQGAPSPSPSPTSPHGRTWQNAFESRLKGPKQSSPSIDDALASIAADADSIISEPVTLSPVQSLRGKANFFASSTDTSPHMPHDSDAVELIMDEADLSREVSEPATSANSSSNATAQPALQSPESSYSPEQPRSGFDTTQEESKEGDDEGIDIEEPSWLSELKVRRRPAPFTSRPEAFTIPPSTSDKSIAQSTSDTSLAYAAETISSSGSIHAVEDDNELSQQTPRVAQSGFDDQPPSSPLSASHGARLLDIIHKVQQSSRDSTASTGSFSAVSSARTSASSDKVLAAMSFPHRGGEVPSALKNNQRGLLALAPEDGPNAARLRSGSSASNRSGKSSAPSARAGASTPIGDDLEGLMAQIDAMGEDLNLSDHEDLL